MSLWLFAASLSVALCHVTASSQSDPAVFHGLKTSVTLQGETRPLAEFRGIQYATIPARYSPAQPVTPNGTVAAQTHGPACPQPHPVAMSEDCLFLNVYRPYTLSDAANLTGVNDTSISTAHLNTTATLPVYVYAHGGFFLRYWSHRWEPLGLAAFGEIVVVTINYRLGTLGFLTTDTDDMPPNLGLRDQQVALRWVQDNVHLFGGDPSRVTFGGQSAGSTGILMQALDPANENLFQSVVAHSGTPEGLPLPLPKGMPVAVKVAEFVNCTDVGSPQSVKKCLSEASLQALLSYPAVDPDTLQVAVWPVEEYTDTSASHYQEKNILVGFTTEDGSIVVDLYWGEFIARGVPLTPELFESFVSVVMMTPQDSLKMQAITDRYIDYDNPDTRSVLEAAVDMNTEWVVSVPLVNMALHHSNLSSSTNASRDGKTFVYKFSLPEALQVRIFENVEGYEGTPHTADLNYFLGDMDWILNTTAAHSLARQCIQFLGGFIATGTPDIGNGTMQELSLSEQNYVVISDTMEHDKNPAGDGYHFRYSFLPQLEQAEAEIKQLNHQVADLEAQISDSNRGGRLLAWSGLMGLVFVLYGLL